MNERDESAAATKRFAGINIPEDLQWYNFLNLYLTSFFLACLIVIPAILQPAFLKEIINIPKEQAGSINSGLQNMTQVAMLLIVGGVGVLSDKVGRRILAVFGFFVCSIFFILFGHAKDISLAMGITSVGGQVAVTYVIRFIIGLGVFFIFPQCITMIADYTSPRDRGKGMAYYGVMMSLGSMITFGVLAQIAKKTGIMSLFYVAGAVGVLGLLVSWLGLVDRMPKEKTKRIGFKKIYETVSKNIALKACYGTTFVCRADILVLGTFLIVWMVYVAEKHGMSPVKATARGGMVMMVMSVVGLIAQPLVGILLDRIGRTPVIIAGLISSGIGLCFMAITANPFSPLMFLYVILVGVGFSSAAAGANTLASDASPKPLLGSILGGLNTMQPLGVLLFLQVGGFLFDKGGYWAPFLLKGIASLAAGIWMVCIRGRIAEEMAQPAQNHGAPPFVPAAAEAPKK